MSHEVLCDVCGHSGGHTPWAGAKAHAYTPRLHVSQGWGGGYTVHSKGYIHYIRRGTRSGDGHFGYMGTTSIVCYS
jgi:hypothetical protein